MKNDGIIDVQNENIPIQKILHNPQSKTMRRPIQEPYTNLYEFQNINIAPESKPKKKEIIKRDKVTTKKESPKIKKEEPKIKNEEPKNNNEVYNPIKFTNYNDDKNTPYNETWKWPDDYFEKHLENINLLR